MSLSVVSVGTRAARFVPLIFLAMLVGSSSCGYRLVGRGGSFPAGVKRVSVGAFKNRTDRYGLEGEASSTFVRELMATGKVEVGDAADADAWFEGALTSYSTTAISFNAQQEITERRLTITARVDFFVRGEEKPFFSEKRAVGRAEFPVTGNLVRDSEAERIAEGEALEELANRVISRIVEGF